MADPDNLPEDPALETDEVKTNRALEQGLGVGARELAHRLRAEGHSLA